MMDYSEGSYFRDPVRAGRWNPAGQIGSLRVESRVVERPNRVSVVESRGWLDGRPRPVFLGFRDGDVVEELDASVVVVMAREFTLTSTLSFTGRVVADAQILVDHRSYLDGMFDVAEILAGQFEVRTSEVDRALGSLVVAVAGAVGDEMITDTAAAVAAGQARAKQILADTGFGFLEVSEGGAPTHFHVAPSGHVHVLMFNSLGYVRGGWHAFPSAGHYRLVTHADRGGFAEEMRGVFVDLGQAAMWDGWVFDHRMQK